MEQTEQTAPQTGAEESAQMQTHYEALCSQSRQLQQEQPDFSLQKAIRDPVFLLLTHPEVGFSVGEAQKKAASIRSQMQSLRTEGADPNAGRPVEAGLSGQAPALTGFRWKNATAEQRSAQRKAIRDAAARGIKLYPGAR